MTRTCTINIDDEVSCRIAGLTPQDNTSLWEEFGIHVDGYFFMPAFQLGRWDGKVRYFEKKNGKTYTKLLPDLITYLVNWGYEINLVDKRLPVPVISMRATAAHFKGHNSKIELRPYQVDMINKLLDEGSGFAVCGTGGGKTIMCAALCDILQQHGMQTVVIVPSADLITQTITTFKFCGLDVGEYSGNIKNLDCSTVVATWQALQNAPYNMKFFQAVIVDEAHGTKATVVRELINDNGQHIAYRFGVTGTFPKPKADQLALRSSIGNVLAEVTSRWLIDNGYLSEIDIEPIEIVEPRGTEQLPDYASEKAFVSNKEERLELIADLIKLKASENGNTMVLVNSIKQGRALQKLLGDNVVFMYGETDNEARAEKYAEYADSDGLIVIASAGIASTGISIDRIFCLMFIDAGKSFIRCIQSCGRGLRKAGDKNKVQVIDVHASMKWSRKHFKERKKYYLEAEYPTQETIKLTYG